MGDKVLLTYSYAFVVESFTTVDGHTFYDIVENTIDYDAGSLKDLLRPELDKIGTPEQKDKWKAVKITAEFIDLDYEADHEYDDIRCEKVTNIKITKGEK